MTRLDKYLSKSLGISRKDSKRLVLSGRVRVNGKIVRDPSKKVEGSVQLDGKVIEKPRDKIYIMLNKPSGFVSSTRGDQPTVLDLVDHPRNKELFPAGRLDKDAKGLIILTNDGNFAHLVTSPKKHVEKEYEVVIDGRSENAMKLLNGIKLRDGYLTKATRVEILDGKTVRIVVTEGKYHQIKRMMAAVGLKVKELKRIRIGGLTLDVEEGKWRELTKEDLKKILSGHDRSA